jgi:cytochrome c oxidase subunit 2
MRRQLDYYRHGVRGAHPDDTYGQQMRPMAASLATVQIMRNVIAYIETVPDNPVEATVTGDAQRGEKIYRVCGACHGWDGQGIQAVKAPRMAGLQDWYLVRQLENFKQGVRGAHPGDMYGDQMMQMANVLRDEQSVKDVVAYINTLPNADDSQLAMNSSEEE